MEWVLIRGLGRVKEHWFEFPEKLMASGHTVHTIDLPGVGDFKNKKSPLKIADYTEELRNQLQSLRRDLKQQSLALHNQNTQEDRAMPNSFGLIGISLGGMIALDWASRYPDELTYVATVNTSTKDLSPLLHRVSPFGLYCMGRSIVAKSIKEKEFALLKMVSNLRQNDEDLISKMVDLASQQLLPESNILRQLIAASRFLSPDKIKVPVLVMASLKDQMVDVRCSKAIAEKYKAQIKFHPTAGHDLTLDDPSWAADRINEWLTPTVQPPSIEQIASI